MPDTSHSNACLCACLNDRYHVHCVDYVIDARGRSNDSKSSKECAINGMSGGAVAASNAFLESEFFTLRAGAQPATRP
jgi:hypothetical protein